MKVHTRGGFLKKLIGQADETGPSSGEVSFMVSDKGIAAYKGEWGEKQVFHLLRRSLFGVKHEELKHFSGLSMQQCMEELFKPEESPVPPINAYNEGTFIDPHVPLGKTWVHSYYEPTPPGIPVSMRMNIYNSLRRFNLKAWWIGLMIRQKPNITLKMVLFWHTVTPTQMKLTFDARYSYKHFELLHKHALGNYKQFIREVTTDPQMLVYQNGNTNTASAPNENYARELQELFTVGKGPDSHYTEEDVRAAARVLTGWVDNYTSANSTEISSSFQPNDHDTSDKQFSAFYKNTLIKGRSGADGAGEVEELVDMIFDTTEVARALCRKLYRFFIYYNIDDTVEKNVIAPLAELLIAKKFETREVVMALLSSEHFYDSKNMGCIIKNPIDLIIGMVRQFNVALPGDDDYVLQYKTWIALANTLEDMDMNIGDPPSVAGWAANYQKPQYHEFWINSDTLATRNSITDRFLSKEGYNENGVVIKLDFLKFTAQLSDPGNPEKLIAESVHFLSPVPFDLLQTDYVMNPFLLSGPSGNWYWTEVWNRYLANPEAGANREEAEGLLRDFYMYLLSRAEYQLT